MFLKLGPRKREFSGAALVPNMLTTLALCSGLAALHFALDASGQNNNIERAMGAVVIAGVFDALDGRAARLLRVTSGFGAVLDSLSDFLAFGVAPAVILHEWAPNGHKALALAAFMTYALSTGLRLARFTSGAPVPKTPGKTGPAPVASPERHFVGMPSPAAAGIVLIPPMLEKSDTIAWTAPWWAVVVLTFAVAVAMISRLPMFSLKALRISRRWVAPLLVGLGLGVVGMIRDPWLTLCVLSGMYLLSIPLVALSAWRRGPDKGQEQGPDKGPEVPGPAA